MFDFGGNLNVKFYNMSCFYVGLILSFYMYECWEQHLAMKSSVFRKLPLLVLYFVWTCFNMLCYSLFWFFGCMLHTVFTVLKGSLWLVIWSPLIPQSCDITEYLDIHWGTLLSDEVNLEKSSSLTFSNNNLTPLKHWVRGNKTDVYSTTILVPFNRTQEEEKWYWWHRRHLLPMGV